METNIHYTIVGAFVIFLFSAIVLGIIWLSSGFSTERYDTYTVYMQESVSGLNIDSPVEYNGVNVGTVRSVKLDERDPYLVDLELSIKSSTPITRGTTATLTTRGITGITFIALKDKSTDLRPLEILPGQKYPVIATAPSLFIRVDTALKKLAVNIQKVTDSIEALLNPENQAAIKATLSNLRDITATFAENNHQITRIMQNTARITNTLEPLIQSSQSAMMMLQNQTLPVTYNLLNNMNNAARTLSQVSLEIKRNPSVLIRGTQPAPLGPGERR